MQIVFRRLAVFLLVFTFATASIMSLLLAQDSVKDKRSVLAPARDIASNKKSGSDEILSNRKCLIESLTKIATGHSRPSKKHGPRLLAINTLGKMRAKEVVKVFIYLLEKNFTSGIEAGGMDARLAHAERFAGKIQDSLVEIGNPCRKIILMKLARPKENIVDFEVLDKNVTIKHMRKRLLNVFERIEGKECAMFLIKKQIEKEEKPKPKEYLNKCLKILEE